MKKLIHISLSIVMVIFFMPVHPFAAASPHSFDANSPYLRLMVKTGIENLPGKKSSASALSKLNFNKDFGIIKNVTWYRKGDFDVASFTKNNTRMTAYFGMQSELVGTITDKTYADLPAEGRKEIKDQYNGYTVGQIVYFKTYTPNDNYIVLYGTQIENTDSYYVELSKNNKNIVVRVNPLGNVSYFNKMS